MNIWIFKNYKINYIVDSIIRNPFLLLKNLNLKRQFRKLTTLKIMQFTKRAKKKYIIFVNLPLKKLGISQSFDYKIDHFIKHFSN